MKGSISQVRKLRDRKVKSTWLKYTAPFGKNWDLIEQSDWCPLSSSSGLSSNLLLSFSISVVSIENINTKLAKALVLRCVCACER